MSNINDFDLLEDSVEYYAKLMGELAKITQWQKELTERRKEIMDEFKEFLDKENIESLEVDDYTLSTVIRKGSGKWDASKLNKILDPDQLEEVYSVGKSTSYLRLNVRERE